ncbi:hypothetical protein LINPERPRIM_LOCUS1415 [Linum perenne]
MHTFHPPIQPNLDRHRHNPSHSNSSPTPLQPRPTPCPFGYRVRHGRVSGLRQLRDGGGCYTGMVVPLRGGDGPTWFVGVGEDG